MTTEDVPRLGDWMDLAPWRDRAVTLVCVPDSDDHPPIQSHTLAGKRDIIDVYAGRLFVLWKGQYRTSVREIPQADRAEVRRHLGW